MFLKLGDLILNTDHIVTIGFGPDGSASIQFDSDRTDVNELEREHAESLRQFCTAPGGGTVHGEPFIDLTPIR